MKLINIYQRNYQVKSSFANKINFKRIIINKLNLPNQFLYKMLTSRFSQRACLPPNFDTLEILFLSSKDYSSNSLQGWRQFPSHCLVVHRTPSFENIGVGVVFLVFVYYSRSALDSLYWIPGSPDGLWYHRFRTRRVRAPYMCLA